MGSILKLLRRTSNILKNHFSSVKSNTSSYRIMKSNAGKIVSFACFIFIAITLIKCSIAMADKSGNTSAQKCKWEDSDGNCIESCFGGFAVGIRMDKNGKRIDICQCGGEQCNVDPCDECERKAKKKGLKHSHCPCPDLD